MTRPNKPPWARAPELLRHYVMGKKGDRWAALEPVRQGVRTHMDGYAPRWLSDSVYGTTGALSTRRISSRAS